MYKPKVAALFKATTDVRKGAPLGNNNAAGDHRPFARASIGGTSASLSSSGGGVARAFLGTPKDAGPNGTKNLSAHIAQLGALAVPGTTYRPRQGTKGMLSVETKASHQEIFSKLSSMGFSPQIGDKKDAFHTNIDAPNDMVKTNTLHHKKSGVSVAVLSQRHGKANNELHFQQHGIEQH